jgi:enoyl-[acyl-carrier protein] reductase II
MIKNDFWEMIKTAESQGAGKEELMTLLGKGRARKGIFEGNLEDGELEIGQISAQISQIKSSSAILTEIWNEFLIARKEMGYST